jgi:hypothetical protein
MLGSCAGTSGSLVFGAIEHTFLATFGNEQFDTIDTRAAGVNGEELLDQLNTFRGDG